MKLAQRQGASIIASIGLAIGVLFSLLYMNVYPLLIGGGVIYWYPYWSPALAAAYVVCGTLIQGWFCYRLARNATWGVLVGQVLTGIGYLAATLLTGGSLYMS